MPALDATWRKSTRSGGNGACVEARYVTGLDATWRKSTRSSTNGSCVEARHTNATVEVRDTKDHAHGPTLRFPAPAWTAFIAAL